MPSILSEASYRVLTELLPQVVWAGLPDGQITYCNAYWYEYTGLTEEGTLGTGWADSIHPDHRARVYQTWQAAVAANGSYEVEIPFRRGADGVYRWFLARGLPVRDASGNVVQWIGTAIDIHDQKESAETLRHITETMPQLVWSTRADGYHDYYNQRWYEYTGMTYEETKDKGWSHLLHPDDYERSWQVWRYSLETGAPYEIEYRFRRHDGVYRWFIGRALPLRDTYGNILRWFGTCTDIDDYRRQRDELQQSQQFVEQLNQQLRRSVTETHHRVKNNLQIISALIDTQALEHRNETVAEEFRRLNSHVRSMAAVHDVLTQQSQSGGHASRMSVRAMLEKMVPMLQTMAGNRRILTRIDDAELPGKQGTSLALITNELVLNALKHGRGDVEVGFCVDGANARLEVRDDGPGFPAGFDPMISSNVGIQLIESVGRWDLGGEVFYENKQNEPGAVVTVTIALDQFQDAIQPIVHGIEQLAP